MTKRHYITLLFLTLALVAGARHYVVLVGIADYPGTKSDLKVSAQDAVTMKTLCDRNGDAVTEMLTDAEATVENVKVALAHLFARATRDDDHNRTITARELFDFVSKGVAKDSREKQHPVMWGKFDDAMPIMVWKSSNL